MNYLCDDPEFWRRKEERKSKPATPLFVRDVKPAGVEGVVELPAAWAFRAMRLSPPLCRPSGLSLLRVSVLRTAAAIARKVAA